MASKEEFCTGGEHFGDLVIDNKQLTLRNIASNKPTFVLPLDGVTQCVMPGMNSRKEVELQFQEPENRGDDDNLVQITFHFPEKKLKDVAEGSSSSSSAAAAEGNGADKEGDDAEGDDEEEDEETPAELFYSKILDADVIRNTTTDDPIMVEFSKEQGTFLTPRGRYGIQMTSNFLRMVGAQYNYKIMYSDIELLFLLPRPDNVRKAFVISLKKPIRQGNQRYQHLVLETHRWEETVTINATEEEALDIFKGKLNAGDVTMELCDLIANVFKFMTKTSVNVPKTIVEIPKVFISAGKGTALKEGEVDDTKQRCVRCSLKANEGHLYPLTKYLVFIHKPTIIVNYADVEQVEFQRFSVNTNSATKNFDVVVTVKSSTSSDAAVREFAFLSIERKEFTPLYSFFENKGLTIKGVDASDAAGADANEDKRKSSSQPLAGMDVGSDDGSESDGDYDGGGSDDEQSGSDSDESGDESVASGDNQVAAKKSSSKEKEKSKDRHKSKDASSSPSKKSKIKKELQEKLDRELKKKAAELDSSDDGLTDDSGDEAVTGTPTKGKKIAGKKDKNAPKGPKTAYLCYLDAMRTKIKEENPTAAFGDLARLAAEGWKALSAEDRVQYDEAAAKDKERYKDEMSSYVPPSPAADEGGKKKKRKTDTNAPKGALTSYIIFAGDVRGKIKEEHPEWSLTECAKEIGVRWKALSPEEKAVYEEMQKADKKRYEQQMAEYSANGSFQSVDKLDSLNFGGTGITSGALLSSTSSSSSSSSSSDVKVKTEAETGAVNEEATEVAVKTESTPMAMDAAAEDVAVKTEPDATATTDEN